MIWTGSANSHTGQRRFTAAEQAGQMAASDYVSETPEFTLALKGASTDGKQTIAVPGSYNPESDHGAPTSKASARHAATCAM